MMASEVAPERVKEPTKGGSFKEERVELISITAQTKPT